MYRHGANCLRGPASRTSPWWSVATAGPSIRVELVERVRREIAAGIYETPEKWQAALERLLRRLEEE